MCTHVCASILLESASTFRVSFRARVVMLHDNDNGISIRSDKDARDLSVCEVCDAMRVVPINEKTNGMAY